MDLNKPKGPGVADLFHKNQQHLQIHVEPLPNLEFLHWKTVEFPPSGG